MIRMMALKKSLRADGTPIAGLALLAKVPPTTCTLNKFGNPGESRELRRRRVENNGV
jgi:hypothetical protein